MHALRRPASARPPPRPPDAVGQSRRGGPGHLKFRVSAGGGDGGKSADGDGAAHRPRQQRPPPPSSSSLASRAARLRRLRAKIDADLARVALDGQALPRRERRAVEAAVAGTERPPQAPGRGAAAPAAVEAAGGRRPSKEEKERDLAAFLAVLEGHTGPGWGVTDPREEVWGGPAESGEALRARLTAGSGAGAPRGGPPPAEWRRRLARAAEVAEAAGLKEFSGVRPAPHADARAEAGASAAHRALLLLRRGLLTGDAARLPSFLDAAGFLGCADDPDDPSTWMAWSDELAAGVGAAGWAALWAALGRSRVRVEGAAAWMRVDAGRADPSSPAFTVVADFYLHVPSPAWLTAAPGGAWRRRGQAAAGGGGGGQAAAEPPGPPPPPQPPSTPVLHRVAAFVADPGHCPPVHAARREEARAAAVAAAPGLAAARAAVAAARRAAARASPPPTKWRPASGVTAGALPPGVGAVPPPGWAVTAAVEGWRARGAVPAPPGRPPAAVLAPPAVLSTRPAAPTVVDVAVSGGLRRVVVWPVRRRTATAPPPARRAPFRRSAPTVQPPAFDALAALTPAGLKPKGPRPVSRKQKEEGEAAAAAAPADGDHPPPAFDPTPPADAGGAWRDGSHVTVGVTLQLTLEEWADSGPPGRPALRVVRAASRWAGALIADGHEPALAQGVDIGSVVASAAGLDRSEWGLGVTSWPRRAPGAGLGVAVDDEEGGDVSGEVEEEEEEEGGG